MNPSQRKIMENYVKLTAEDYFSLDRFLQNLDVAMDIALARPNAHHKSLQCAFIVLPNNFLWICGGILMAILLVWHFCAAMRVQMRLDSRTTAKHRRFPHTHTHIHGHTIPAVFAIGSPCGGNRSARHAAAVDLANAHILSGMFVP